MSRNNFDFEIPDNKRLSKDEAVNLLTPMIGESLATKFANNMPEPGDVDVLKPCEDDTAQFQKTNFIPPTWASEMNKDKPAMVFMDEYRIENGKEWHNGK